MDEKKMLEKLTAEEFKNSNGIVMRAISLAFPMRWFGYRDLKTVTLDRVKEEQLKKTLVYLTDEGYLNYRREDGVTAADILDNEFDELQWRTSARGTRLIECVEDDTLIDM